VVKVVTPDGSDAPIRGAIVKSSQLHLYRSIGRKPS